MPGLCPGQRDRGRGLGRADRRGTTGARAGSGVNPENPFVLAALVLGTWAVVLAPVFLRYRLRRRRARVPASPGHPVTAVTAQPRETEPYEDGPVSVLPGGFT